MTGALVDAVRARGGAVLHNSAVTALETAGGRIKGVRSSTGFHAAETVVLAAGTGTPRLCEPLSPGLRLPVTASPARPVRLAAPVGLVRSIVAGSGFEVREVRDGDLLLIPPQAAGASATSPEQIARGALGRLRSAFRASDDCRVLGSRVGSRPMPAQGPLIGHVTEDRSVYVAVAHSAVTLAPTVGRLVADELVTGRPAPELRRCRPPGPAR